MSSAVSPSVSAVGKEQVFVSTASASHAPFICRASRRVGELALPSNAISESPVVERSKPPVELTVPVVAVSAPVSMCTTVPATMSEVAVKVARPSPMRKL
jgi:hypothetical protein